MESPEGVSSTVSGAPCRGACVGGSAVSHRAARELGGVPFARDGDRRCPPGQGWGQSCPLCRVSSAACRSAAGQCFALWPCWGSVVRGAEVAPMAARGICGVPYSHAKRSSRVIAPLLLLS